MKFLPDYLLGCTTYTIAGCNLNYHKISVQCSLFTPIFIQTILLSEEINRFVTDSSRSKLSAPIAQTPPGVAMLTSPTTRRTQCSKRGLKTITCGGGGGGWLHNRKSTCPHLPTWGSTLMTYGFVLIMRCFVIQPFDAYCFLVSFQ